MIYISIVYGLDLITSFLKIESKTKSLTTTEQSIVNMIKANPSLWREAILQIFDDQKISSQISNASAHPNKAMTSSARPNEVPAYSKKSTAPSVPRNEAAPLSNDTARPNKATTGSDGYIHPTASCNHRRPVAAAFFSPNEATALSNDTARPNKATIGSDGSVYPTAPCNDTIRHNQVAATLPTSSNEATVGSDGTVRPDEVTTTLPVHCNKFTAPSNSSVLSNEATIPSNDSISLNESATPPNNSIRLKKFGNDDDMDESEIDDSMLSQNHYKTFNKRSRSRKSLNSNEPLKVNYHFIVLVC